MRLEGKVAIITGSGSGFGQAAAVRFAEEGARVVVVDRDGTGAEATCTLVAGGGGEGEPVVADVSTAEGADAAVEAAVTRFGGVDVLVNNAGIVNLGDSWHAEERVWDLIMRVNLKSVFLCTRAAVPVMVERGGGSIVNTASIAASSSAGAPIYAAAKGGMISYTRHVSSALAPKRIRVNCVSPGFMHTPMTSGERTGLTPEEQEERLRGFGQKVPMGHVGSMLDIANAMLYLASDESAYVTGQELVVDGGYLVR